MIRKVLIQVTYHKMVKLQESKGRYWITIGIDKIKIGRFSKGDRFDISFNKQGQLVLSKIE